MLSRKRLVELFDLSGIRASEWVKEFRSVYPDFSYQDNQARAHKATTALYQWYAEAQSDVTLFALVGLDQYLSLVKRHVIPGGWLVEGFVSLASPSPAIFACLQRAIGQKVGVAIEYGSMARPEPHSRMIFPHAIVCTGQRWHVRGFSPEHGEFRDHNIGRILSAELVTEACPVATDSDQHWQQLVAVHLIAHPSLTSHQAAVVKHEYFGGVSGRVDHIRAALVPYFIAEKQLAFDPAVQTPPNYLLAVGNPKELKPWMF
jgi:hypothetical protein